VQRIDISIGISVRSLSLFLGYATAGETYRLILGK
jgi:hypothetical protein